MDLQRLIDNQKRRLEIRNAALKNTLDELQLVEQLEATTPGAYTAALAQLRIKRDRQQAAATSTEAMIKGFITATKKAR